MPEQGKFHGGAEIAADEGFDEVGQWQRMARALKCVVIRKGREVDHRDFILLLDASGGLDAVHRALQFDIHQDEIRDVLAGEPNGIGARGCHPDHHVADRPKLSANILRHDNFIVNDENFGLYHAISTRSQFGPVFIRPAPHSLDTPVRPAAPDKTQLTCHLPRQ
ncbi:MAG: hypothetical protein U0231_11635 [Nitrospiraceae bacterium]